jgi:hypothetical protein
MRDTETQPYGAEWHASDLTDLFCRLQLDEQQAADALGVDRLELQSWIEGYSPAPKMALIALNYLVSNERARLMALSHRDLERAAEQWLVVPVNGRLQESVIGMSCAEALQAYHTASDAGSHVELWHAVMVRAQKTPG